MADDLQEDMREARRHSGMTFAKFAPLTGFAEPYLRNVENGNRAITVDVAKAYDRVLDTGGVFLATLKDQISVTSAPWDQAGTVSVLSQRLNDGGADRRSRTLTSATLTGIIGRWSVALNAPDPLVSTGSRQIKPALIEHIDQRLEHLRYLDDELGSGDLAQLARNELTLIVSLLRDGNYPECTGRRLYSLAAEAGRQVAWGYFDQNHHAAALRFFEMALRASATADDPVAGAYALSFMAVQCYSTGQAQQAVSLLEAAQNAVASVGTPRMVAMLAARSARALSKTGDRKACAHKLHQARTALEKGPSPDDPPTLYWVTEGEIEMIAGSSALELGDPAEAIRRFDAAISSDYPGDDQYPRTHAIYLARAAEAHLALHDLDAAVSRATHAMRCLNGVDSARSTSTLAGLKTKLTPRELDSTAVRTPAARASRATRITS